jgi:hypothetical protein
MSVYSFKKLEQVGKDIIKTNFGSESYSLERVLTGEKNI